MLSKNIIKCLKSIASSLLVVSPLLLVGCSDIGERADEALSKLSNYEYEEGLMQLAEFEEIVSEASNSDIESATVENSIIKYLKSDATLASKQFVCQQLSIIGSNKSIPILNEMMGNDETADIALYPLERIPEKDASEVLIKHLDSKNNIIQLGCINALGVRECKASISKLSEYLTSEDQEIAIASALALGQIKGNEAIEVLKTQLKNENTNVQVAVANSYLSCADGLKKDDAIRSISIYSEVYSNKYPMSSRQAALAGLIIVSDNKEEIILKSLSNDEEPLKYIAIDGIRQLPSESEISAFSDMLSNFSEANQIQLLGVIKDRADKNSKNAVIGMLASKDLLVRIAALQAIAVIGNNNDVLNVAKIAAKNSGIERRNARQCLDLISDEKTDVVIVNNISSAEKKVKIELIRSAGARGITSSFNILLENTESEDRQIRTASYLAIAEIATGDKLPVLISQLYSLPFESDRRRMERTISKTLSIYPEEKFAQLLIDNINNDKSESNIGSSLKLLGVTGNSKAFEILKKYVENENQTIKIGAIEGLASWSTPEPLYDLLKATENAENNKVRQPALKGFTNFIGEDKTLDPKTKFELYSKALKYSNTGNEKNLTLEGIGHVYLFESLDVLKTYYKDPSVTETVEDGINRVSWNLIEEDAEKVRSFVLEIIEITKDEQYKERLGRIVSTIDLQTKE